ncbi:hypothetical protein BD779DRAFT_1569969 [Infundibulicybe gibba]|nr:hypothetical protein BD779DRAFT_1569969 [Infundibulicybe gibba]
MVPRNLLTLFALPTSLVPFFVSGQRSTFPATPLVSKEFPSPTSLPYQVDQDPELIRGRQSGYNICNSTTENQNSQCQTSYVNSLDDFCLWAPMRPNSVVAETEGEMVAWCVQYIKTPDYAQSDDYGGEMDPHGADLRGNPLGGIVYSTAFDGQAQQVIQWHNFMGNNIFCIKVCDPSGPDAARYCDHKFDRIGCAYNAPNAARNGTFESCDGDNQDSQPAESLGPITSMPYTAKVPASSNCKQFSSTSAFAALATVSNSAVLASATPTSGAQTSSRATSSASGSRNATATGVAPSSGASTLVVPSVSVFAILVTAFLL